MENQFERTEKLIGGEALQKLKSSRVAVFGIGGVGGACAEALARMGIGAIDLYDNDVVTPTNINRQTVALYSTIGRYKVDVMEERIMDINPECRVTCHKVFYMPDTSESIDLSCYDCIIDAIDTVTGKIELIIRAKAAGVNIICSMGAGNRMDPTKFTVTDISKTEMDPLAKTMRKELRSRGIKDVLVVWSKEPPSTPVIPANEPESSPSVPRTPASNSFVPPTAGLILAAEAVKHLI